MVEEMATKTDRANTVVPSRDGQSTMRGSAREVTGASGIHVRSEARPSYRVLVIDDEALIGRLLAMTLDRDAVEYFDDPERALARAREVAFDLVFCDLMMPSMTGIEVHRALMRMTNSSAPRFVLMTGSAIGTELEAFLNRERVRLLRKPFALPELELCLAGG
jgi:CheY-like chemotaxis protein